MLRTCHYGWSAWALVVFLLLQTAKVGAQDATLTLAKNGQPQCRIITADAPTRAASLAALELQWHLGQIIGEMPVLLKESAVLESVGSSGSSAAPAVQNPVAIHVGETKQSANAGFASGQWKEGEYAIRADGNAIYLLGHDKEDRALAVWGYDKAQTWPSLFDAQGSLHAVYQFLEDSCSVRWWTPTELGVDIPKNPSLQVTSCSVRRVPDFRYREVFWASSDPKQIDRMSQLWQEHEPEFEQYLRLGYPAINGAAKNKAQRDQRKGGLNKLWMLRMRLGGTMHYRCNHSLYGYYDRFYKKNPKNPEVFEQAHPEWFAQGYDKIDESSQLCYTAPGLAEQVIQDARDYFDGKGLKYRAVAFGDYFAVCPMDNGAICKCDRCRARYNTAEGNTAYFSSGRFSDIIFGFCNQIAKGIKQSHPNKKIATLAYAGYARYPQNTKLEDNISVQLCLHMRNNYNLLLQERDREILESWTTKEKNREIFLWLYYCFPVENGHRAKPSWHVFPGFFATSLEQSFKQYHEKNLQGAFFNGFGQDLESYLSCKFLADASQDGRAITGEFFTRMYGSAGAPLLAFYREVEEAYGNSENYPVGKNGMISHQTESTAWLHLGTPSRMARLERYMQEAYLRADSELARQRVMLFDLAIWQYMQTGIKQYVPYPNAWRGINATLTRAVGRPAAISLTDSLKNQTFVSESPGTLILTDHPLLGEKGNIRLTPEVRELTDGRQEATFFLQNNREKAVSVRCELGAVPATGRQLTRLDITWSLQDGVRSRACFRVFVRNAATQDWFPVTERIRYDQFGNFGGMSSQQFSLTYPEGAVRAFDAIRLVDMAGEEGWLPTRFIEFDAEFSTDRQLTSPQKGN